MYSPSGNGDLKWVRNDIHDDHEQQESDKGGRNVSVGHNFWYFGSVSPALTAALGHLVPYPRGHTVNKYRRTDDIEKLISWLSAWFCGIHGAPIDASVTLKEWLAAGNLDVSDDASTRTATRCRRC